MKAQRSDEPVGEMSPEDLPFQPQTCGCALTGNPLRPETKYLHECQWHAEQRLRLIAQVRAEGAKEERAKVVRWLRNTGEMGWRLANNLIEGWHDAD